MPNRAARKNDLFDRDVYYEDDPINPNFFNITGFPDYLTYGKHYGMISFFDHTEGKTRLKDNSKVLFEFADREGRILNSGTTNYDPINGSTPISVWIKENPIEYTDTIKDGRGTIIIIAELENVPKGLLEYIEEYKSSTPKKEKEGGK